MASLLSYLQRSLKGLLILVPVLIGLVFTSQADAASWDAETLTVPADPEGIQVTFSEQEFNTGRKVFNTSCGTCHAGGITKTNHNVGLDPETLALATPARDNVDALVDYVREPTSYDGEYSIADLHPSIRDAELYPAMRSHRRRAAVDGLLHTGGPQSAGNGLGRRQDLLLIERLTQTDLSH